MTALSEGSTDTPQRPLIDTGSLVLDATSKQGLSSAAAEAATDLSDLMNKLKPHWPNTVSSTTLSPEIQIQRAMSSFIEAKAQKVAEFMVADKLIANPKEIPAEAEAEAEAEEESGIDSESAPASQDPSSHASMTEMESGKDPETPKKVANKKIAETQEKLEEILDPGKEETQLQKELCQLEKIVQDLCSEVSAGSKDSKASKASTSRIPTPTRVKTPFALSHRLKNSSTISLYPPKPVKTAISCLYIDASMTRYNGNPVESSSFGPTSRGNSRTPASAFGRTISSTSRTQSKIRNVATVPYQSQSKKQQQRKTSSASASSRDEPNKTPLNKWTANVPSSHPLQPELPSHSPKTSNLPSRETSKTSLPTRTNSYRQLFQMKQSLAAAKSTAPIHLKKAQNGGGQRGGGTPSSSGSSRSRARTPMIPTERTTRKSTTAHPTLSQNNNSTGGGYLSVHGSGSRVLVQNKTEDPKAKPDQGNSNEQPVSGSSPSPASQDAGSGQATEV